MITYLEQMKRAAKEAGVDLTSACDSEGIADTTLARWNKKEACPREATARAVLNRIKRMARAEETQEAS